MTSVRWPVAAVLLAGALVSGPAALAASGPPGPAVITGHGMNHGRITLPSGLSSVVQPDYTTTPLTNWAGWADIANTNVELRYVSANFVVPTVTCPAYGYDVSFWVGLDGDREGKTVEQVGVNALCDISKSGGGYSPDYTSWWEMAPNNPVTKGSVSPGDQIAVSTYYNSSTNEYHLELNDGNRTGADINVNESCPGTNICHNQTAEVIAEDSGNSGPAGGDFLAKFSPVTFTQIAVTSRDGTHGTLEGNGLWSSDKIPMVYQGKAMATPSTRNDGYTSFNVTWNSSG